MSQDLTFQAGEAVYQYRISRADWQLIQVLRTHLPGEIEALFDAPSLGEVVRVHAATLCAAADAVAAFVSGNKDVLPYTY